MPEIDILGVILAKDHNTIPVIFLRLNSFDLNNIVGWL